MYEIVKSVCLNGKQPEKWFYKGLTYLISKDTPTRGNNFRPITCMSNLYKLTTKCATKFMQLLVEEKDYCLKIRWIQLDGYKELKNRFAQ